MSRSKRKRKTYFASKVMRERERERERIIKITMHENCFISLRKYIQEMTKALDWSRSKVCKPMCNQSHNLHIRNA